MRLSDLISDIATALKAHDSVRVETLRFLVSAVKNSAIAKYGSEAESKLTEEDIADVIKKQVKTHKESIEVFTKAGRTDLVERESKQLAVLESFLPAQLSDTELEQILIPILQTKEPNFGLLMKSAMAVVGGKAEGSRVAGMLKKLQRT